MCLSTVGAGRYALSQVPSVQRVGIPKHGVGIPDGGSISVGNCARGDKYTRGYV